MLLPLGTAGCAVGETRPVGSGGQHYVAPSGSPSGDGSINSPWDLQTALNQPASVQPGDTIWLRGGTYSNPGPAGFASHLNGTAAHPIMVRNYNGERTTLDGKGASVTLPVYGSYTWYWGLELMDSSTARIASVPGVAPPRAAGVITYGPGNKFINMVVHDTNGGFGAGEASPDNEFYGNLDYYNGWIGPDRNHGHGFYLQNITGTKVVADNLVGDNADEGFQIYGSSNAHIIGFRIFGNITYNTSSWPTPHYQYNYIIAGGGVRQDIQFANNYSYFTLTADYGFVDFGQYSPGQDISVQDSVFVGGSIAVDVELQAGPVVFTGNKIYTRPSAAREASVTLGVGQTLASYTWNNNTYYGLNRFYDSGTTTDFVGWQQTTGLDKNSTFVASAPTGLWVYVRPNKYEPKRANLAIYNWDLAGAVMVDLSSVLSAGDRFEVRDAQNFYGPAVVAGTYSGGPVTIPMVGLGKAAPIGFNAPAHTAPEFGTFIVLPVGAASTPPSS